jgi:hypothetical protein
MNTVSLPHATARMHANKTTGQISIVRHPHTRFHHSRTAHDNVRDTNTHNSYGWGTLIVAGGGAYYFAKRSINADRAAKADIDRQKRIRVFQLEQEALNSHTSHQNHSSSSDHNQTSQTEKLLNAAPQSGMGSKAGAGSGIAGSPGYGGGADESGNPSMQASHDPAPTRHEPVDKEQRAREKSKYEASDVYRSRKGDRFS